MTEDFFMRLCDVYGFAPSRALRELVDAAIGQAVVAMRYEAARLTGPVQRKPLTEEEITQCFADAGINIKGQQWVKVIRNVERAHGIGGAA